jgi:ribosomal protein L28
MNKTKRKFSVNLVKSVLSSEEDRWITLRVAASDKTINKNGIDAVLKKASLKDLLNNLFQNKTIARWQKGNRIR